MCRDHRAHQVELFQGGGDGPVRGQPLGQVQGAEQRADMALPQPRHIGVDSALSQLQVVPGQVAQRPGQSAVAVGDGVRDEQGVGALQGLGVRVGGVRIVGERSGRPGREGVGQRQLVERVDLGRGMQVVLEICHGGLRTCEVIAVRSPSHA